MWKSDHGINPARCKENICEGKTTYLQEGGLPDDARYYTISFKVDDIKPSPSIPPCIFLTSRSSVEKYIIEAIGALRLILRTRDRVPGSVAVNLGWA